MTAVVMSLGDAAWAHHSYSARTRVLDSLSQIEERRFRRRVIVRRDVRMCFDAFTLDLDARQLTADGREIHLAPKALKLLTMLVLERPKAIATRASRSCSMRRPSVCADSVSRMAEAP
jgi:DNA-binding response OmpR family regulator